MRLHLVRHPQTEIGSGICYGATDVSVHPAAMQATAMRLAQILPRRTAIITSPLRRCAGLADALASLIGTESVSIDARLKEMDFGTWEMRRWDEISRREIAAWADDLVDYRPGGKESVLDVAARVAALRSDLRHRHDAELILICHAGTIRLLLAEQPGLSLRETAQRAAATPHTIGYGTVTALDL